MLPKHRSRKKRELKFRLETPIFKNETIMHELLFDENKNLKKFHQKRESCWERNERTIGKKIGSDPKKNSKQVCQI